jgi:MFS family permease
MSLSALAPAMPVVVLGCFLVGCGSAAQFAVSLTSTIREVPSDARARVFAITGFAWIIPGLVGPSAGALIASTAGWRWALVAPAPLVLASQLLLGPMLRDSPPTAAVQRSRIPFLSTALATVGITALLSVLAEPGRRSLLIGIPAAGVTLWGLARLLPPGTLRAAPGLPAAIAVQFTLSLAYFAGDGFLPLALTSVLGRTLAQAGIALTLSTLAWAAAGWWQSRVAARASPHLLITAGGALILLGAVGVITVLLTGAWVFAYVTWTAAGVGMGIAYQTSWLLGSALATKGHEGTAVSSLILAETLGSSLGGGLTGGALAAAGTSAPKTGLIAAFGVVAAAAALTTLLGLRQPRRPVGDAGGD